MSAIYSSIDDNTDENFPLTNDRTPILGSNKGKKYTERKIGSSAATNMGKLSFWSKICFALGGIPYQMCNNAIGLYIATFLLEIAEIRPSQISIILFTARGWDAITDPLVGYFVSKTNTRFGKLRPWILFAAPFSIFTYMMFWYVPPLSRESKTAWYLIFYCLFQTFLSCLHVPYTSLTMYLTPNQTERDSATGYRMVFEVAGVLLAALIQGVMISIYNLNFSCDITNTTARMVTDLDTNILKRVDVSPIRAYSKLGEGYLVSAGVMGAIYFACCCATFFGTKEMKDVIEDKDKDFFVGLKSVFKHKSYITLLLAFLFNSLSVQVIQTNFALYCKYSIDAKDSYQNIIITLLVSAVISLPFWNMIMTKIGKKSTYAFGLMIIIPILFVLLYFKNPVWVMYVLAVICGLSIAVNFLLPWSMLPDVIDEFMLLTGTRRESIFYSFYVFFTKLAAGVAVSLSTAFLELGGYIDCPNGCCTQPESVGITLRLLMVPGPMLLLLAALICIWFHPIDEERRKKVKADLDSLRKQIPEEQVPESFENENTQTTF